MGFSISFPWYGEMQQSPSYRVNLVNWYSYFSHSMGDFRHKIPILWYTSSYGKCMGLPINFSQYREMQQNPLYGENLGNWYSYSSYMVWVFFPIRFPFYGIFHHMGNGCVFSSFGCHGKRQPNPSNG